MLNSRVLNRPEPHAGPPLKAAAVHDQEAKRIANVRFNLSGRRLPQ